MTIKMYGVDVASYQGNFDISSTSVAGKKMDFVIAKATQGTNYVNPYCDTVIQHAIKAGKPFGFYHYFDGSDYKAEVDYFIKNTWQGYGRKGIPCFDWEQGGNRQFGNHGYLKNAADYFHSKTGVWPIIYVMASAVSAVASTGIFHDCALWCAGYPYNQGTWSVPNFSYSIPSDVTMIMWQFDSANGYDKNVSYIDAQTWAKYANPNNSTCNNKPSPQLVVNKQPELRPSTIKYRLHVQGGSWLPTVTDFGNGDDGYAGLPCHKHDMLTVSVSHGTLKYRVHVLGGDWLDWVSKSDISDEVNGVAGIRGRTIDGVQMIYLTPNGEQYQEVWYRTQDVNHSGYHGVVCDDGKSISGYTDTYAGVFGQPIDRLQAKISTHNPF